MCVVLHILVGATPTVLTHNVGSLTTSVLFATFPPHTQSNLD